MDSNKETKFSIQYGPKDILDKKFKNKVRGYDPDEVDEFLDGIIRDYEAFTNQTNAAATNYDILKRLSNLERHVFGSKLSDSGSVDNRDDSNHSDVDQY